MYLGCDERGGMYTSRRRSVYGVRKQGKVAGRGVKNATRCYTRNFHPSTRRQVEFRVEFLQDRRVCVDPSDLS